MNNLNDNLVLYLTLDNIQDNIIFDSSNLKQNGTASGGANLVPDDRFGACLKFDGIDDRVTVDTSRFTSVTNTFTVAAWVMPTTVHQVDIQATTGKTGTSGQKFMVYPDQGDSTYSSGHAGAGVSVGTNGIRGMRENKIPIKQGQL